METHDQVVVMVRIYVLAGGEPSLLISATSGGKAIPVGEGSVSHRTPGNYEDSYLGSFLLGLNKKKEGLAEYKAVKSKNKEKERSRGFRQTLTCKEAEPNLETERSTYELRTHRTDESHHKM